MDRFDESLRQRAAEENFPLPEDFDHRVRRTCASLNEITRQKQRYHYGAWIAAALALFIAIPNVSVSFADAVSEIPVLGAIVNVICFRNYVYDDGHRSMNISVPELSGGDTVNTVNQEIGRYTNELMEQFDSDCEGIGDGYRNLNVSSEVLTNTDKWFTLRIEATQIEASSYTFSRFYHIDKMSGQIVRLKDLFTDGADYVTTLSDDVLQQMNAQIAENPGSAYFPEEFSGIDENQNFYINSDGDLVLVFDEFTIAAGSMGMPEFTIDRKIYQNLLKEEYQKGIV